MVTSAVLEPFTFIHTSFWDYQEVFPKMGFAFKESGLFFFQDTVSQIHIMRFETKTIFIFKGILTNILNLFSCWFIKFV